MKLKIKSLQTKTVSTKFGSKEKWIIQTEDGQYFDSFVGQFNQDWKEGTEIEIPESQIKSREWEGKTYKSIIAPPQQFGGGNNQAVLDGLKGILDLLKKIDGKQDQILKVVGFSEAPAEEIQDCPL